MLLPTLMVQCYTAPKKLTEQIALQLNNQEAPQAALPGKQPLHGMAALASGPLSASCAKNMCHLLKIGAQCSP
jgi:hypothetical protein